MEANESEGSQAATRNPEREKRLLVNADAVAEILGCSVRHVWNMADSGRMPRPLALGRLRRWDRRGLEAWIAGGCQPVRPATRARIRG